MFIPSELCHYKFDFCSTLAVLLLRHTIILHAYLLRYITSCDTYNVNTIEILTHYNWDETLCVYFECPGQEYGP